jgi:hypothetical protein
MSFINYDSRHNTGYLDYGSEIDWRNLNLNEIRSLASKLSLPNAAANTYTRMSPFEGRGLYNANSEPLYDDCFTTPFNAHYGTQGNCSKLDSSTKVFRPMTTRSVDPAGTANPSNLSNMRQNGSHNLPDHFSRFGYNDQTGGATNGYVLGNHNGRYICGPNEVGKGIYATPEGLAPQSWYDKKKRQEQETYWFPYTPKPLLPGYERKSPRVEPTGRLPPEGVERKSPEAFRALLGTSLGSPGVE